MAELKTITEPGSFLDLREKITTTDLPRARVLHVTSVYYPELRFGGPPLKIHLLNRGLRARGFSISVITFHSEKRFCKEPAEFDRISVQYLPWIGRGFRQWPLRFDLLSTAVRQADIIHCYGLYNFLCPIVAWYARKFRKPYLIEPLGMYGLRGRNIFLKRQYHRCFTSWMARNASRIVASSQSEKQDLESLAASTAVVVRRNGIDLAAFKSLPDPKRFRTKYNVGASTRIILYLGRISPIKNLEELIRAFYTARCHDSVLLLAGPTLEPGYASKIRTLIASLNLQAAVQLIGPLYDEDKFAAFAATNLLVLPSLSESFGNAAAEAVAAGVPVLLTETCGIAPMIHQRAGFAVPLGEASLAEGLHIMTGPDRVRYLQQQKQVAQELAWDEPVDQTAQLYTSILTECSAVQ
jgi:glycosyltransferase involved in cell wall biosynthesis